MIEIQKEHLENIFGKGNIRFDAMIDGTKYKYSIMVENLTIETLSTKLVEAAALARYKPYAKVENWKYQIETKNKKPIFLFKKNPEISEGLFFQLIELDKDLGAIILIVPAHDIKGGDLKTLEFTYRYPPL